MDETALDQLASETARISELVIAADLTTQVAHLPRWKVRDVVAHLGGVHEWANRIVTDRSMDGPGIHKSKLDGRKLCEWFDAGAGTLVETLRADPNDPCPNFNPGSEKNVAWWIRRQLHETTVHRWDIETALDQVTPLDADTASDGVDEFLDVFVRTRGKHTLPAPLVLQTHDTGAAWTLTPATKPGRVDVATGRSNAEATLSASAETLLLALWGRPVPGPDITVEGERSVALEFGIVSD